MGAIHKDAVPPTLMPDRQLQARQQWLDRLWQALFDGEYGGLMSPGQIRRERRNRGKVRQLEMAAILEAEAEINAIHSGSKALDDHGNVIDTPHVDPVATHSIIENSQLDTELDVSLLSPASMLQSAVREVSVRDLERSLNLRKLAILAESEILQGDVDPLSQAVINAEWVMRWRQSAQDSYSPELQVIWARMIAMEVASPGRFSRDTILKLSQLDRNDLDKLSLLAKYAMDEVIFDARNDYFDTRFHRSLFEDLEELGIFSSIGGANLLKNFASLSQDRYVHLLSVGRRGLLLTTEDRRAVFTMPIIKLSRTGRQLLTLCSAETDLAYLNRIGQFAKQQGFQVCLGEIARVAGKERFTRRMVL